MTDREVYEHLYRRYEPPDTTAEIELWEKQRAEADAAIEAKPLEVRKAEFWAFCKSEGFADAEIQAAWDEYLTSEA